MRRLLAQLLSSYLLIWAPGTFAVELVSALPTMGMRGARGWIELVIHGLVAVLCAVAGRMIRMSAPAATVLAAVGVSLRAIVSLQSLFWTALPSDVAPGMRGPYAIVTCLNGIFWLFVVRRLNRP